MSPSAMSPYAYIIEYGLALGTIKPNEVRDIGLDPMDFWPDFSQVVPMPGVRQTSYKGSKVTTPMKPPYPANDPVLRAVAYGLQNGILAIKQVDWLGLHPAYLVPSNVHFPKLRTE